MNEWQAKYEALKAAIDHQEYIDHAEHLVETALKVSATQPVTFSEAAKTLLMFVAGVRDNNTGQREQCARVADRHAEGWKERYQRYHNQGRYTKARRALDCETAARMIAKDIREGG